jgi:hypothetical protein
MIRIILSAIVVACLACSHTQPQPTPVNTDAGQDISCGAACARGEFLGCEWAKPTPYGHQCSEVCGNAALTVPWDLFGLVHATTCIQ